MDATAGLRGEGGHAVEEDEGDEEAVGDFPSPFSLPEAAVSKASSSAIRAE